MLQLDTRADLRALFFKITGTDDEDEGLAEQFSAVVGPPAFTAAEAAANFYLHLGLWSAQNFVLDSTPGVSGGVRWLTSAALTWTEDEFGQYFALPAGTLRIAGDEHDSAIVRTASYPWGKLIDARHSARHRAGAVYWLQNGRLYIPVDAARPPSDAKLRYFERHAQIPDANDTVADLIDFEPDDRMLIPAYAAWHAFDSGALVDTGALGRIQKSLSHWQGEVASRARRSRAPRHLRATSVQGNSIL